MNRNFYAFIIAVLGLTACEQSKTNKISSTESIKSTPLNKKSEPLYDTTGLSTAPIKVLSAKISSKKVDTVDMPEDNLHHEGHFGRYITLKIKFKNVSSKRIVGVLLNWMILDKNDKPASVGESKNGLQMGYMGTLAPTDLTGYSLGIGETQTEEWEYTSNSGEKIKIAFPAEVQFYDDVKWKIGKK